MIHLWCDSPEVGSVTEGAILGKTPISESKNRAGTMQKKYTLVVTEAARQGKTSALRGSFHCQSAGWFTRRPEQPRQAPGTFRGPSVAGGRGRGGNAARCSLWERSFS